MQPQWYHHTAARSPHAAPMQLHAALTLPAQCLTSLRRRLKACFTLPPQCPHTAATMPQRYPHAAARCPHAALTQPTRSLHVAARRCSLPQRPPPPSPAPPRLTHSPHTAATPPTRLSYAPAPAALAKPRCHKSAGTSAAANDFLGGHGGMGPGGPEWQTRWDRLGMGWQAGRGRVEQWVAGRVGVGDGQGGLAGGMVWASWLEH